MAAIQLSVVIATLLAGDVFAQSTSETVWSSTAFIYHGERLPLQTYRTPALTPYGAQQMLAQGELLRARYLLPNVSFPSSLSGITATANIQGLERNAIDNTQLTILTNTDAYMAPSALAFMQGLYPPRNQSMATFWGGMDAAELSDGTVVNYPLNGYQYPKVQTLSSLDPMSIWIQGHADCGTYVTSATEWEKSATAKLLTEQNAAFFDSLYKKFFWQAGFTQQQTAFTNAYKLYDFALYNSTHQNASLALLSADEMTQLASLASAQQQNLNADLSISGRTSGDKIRAVSGRTLAGKVVSLMRDHYVSGGTQGKLNLIFGAHQPFVAFFALSGLVNGNSRATFEQLPRHGAAMVFEMFTTGSTTTTTSSATGTPSLPAWSDMWVRFLYRPGTESSAALAEYPLFGNGNQQTRMRITDFVSSMESIAFDSFDDWCYACNSTANFCQGSSSGGSGWGSSSGSGSGLSPTVAGAIGAVVGIAAVLLGWALAFVLGGIRLAGRPGVADRQRDSGGSFFGGGFKGAEKRQNDPDVAFARGGTRHERVGSWELRGGPDGGGGNFGDVVGEEHATSASRSGAGASVVATSSMNATLREAAVSPRMRPIDDDAGSVFSATPVKPRESV